ncbi:hypothetical protein HYPGJ_31935 [Hyphomicrobium sp. GJ21]|nr:hypothetical protein HYPGJ_31935 [Hyphomicrobium sp. GJ21]
MRSLFEADCGGNKNDFCCLGLLVTLK